VRPPRTKFEDHPTVQAVRRSDARRESPRTLDADWLRQACLDAGADDVAFFPGSTVDRAREDLVHVTHLAAALR